MLGDSWRSNLQQSLFDVTVAQVDDLRSEKKKPLDILEQFYSLTQALLVYCVLGHRTQRKENNYCSKVSEDIRPISSCTRIRRVKCNRYEKDHAG